MLGGGVPSMTSDSSSMSSNSPCPPFYSNMKSTFDAKDSSHKAQHQSQSHAHPQPWSASWFAH
jgi:hypothetical protein